MTQAVRAVGITKSFDGVAALSDVHLSVNKGTLHAIVGENGAGKTTLMRVLYGAITPDKGTFDVMGRTANFRSPNDAIQAGVGMVSQHYAIIPELTCLENLILGTEPGPILKKTDLKARAEALAQQMGYAIDWQAKAHTLGPAGSQRLEILRLLWRKAELMILDEPTAMLSIQESEALYQSLLGLVDQGRTVIVVTHRIADVLQYASAVTVLRGGVFVHEGSTADLKATELAALIVGRSVEVNSPKPCEIRPEIALEVTGLTVAQNKIEKVKNASLKLHSGEIIAVAGVDGSGQRELVQAILGTMKPVGGSLKWYGEGLDNVPTGKRLAKGMTLIAEDRHHEAVVESWSLVENARIGLQRGPLWRDFLTGKSENIAERVAKRFETKFGAINDPLGSLSGGNQQRFVAGRALEGPPRLILAFQPARGLDILATQRIYQELYTMAKNGAAVLVVIFDLDELLEYFSEVVVMFDGHLSQKLRPEERTRERIGQMMVGAS